MWREHHAGCARSVSPFRGACWRKALPSLASFALILGLAPPAAAQSGEVGAVCVQDYSETTVCTGDDVEATELVLVDVIEPCGPGEFGTAQVVFDVVLLASIDRYDLSTFVALEGGSALLDGTCYHDYLAPPVTTEPTYGDSNDNAIPDLRNGPWVNLEPFDPVDDCGDIQGSTEAIATLGSGSLPLEIACIDTNDDGHVDVSVCVGWRAGTQDHCSGLHDAVAAGSSRCSCTRVELTGLPEPGLASSLATGVALVAWLGRRRRPALDRPGSARPRRPWLLRRG